MNQESRVWIKALNKRYGKSEEVLREIDLEIQSGEFVVLVGPSGCGKSTLLRTIAGLEEATSGEIWIDGRRVDEIAPADRGVAMVFQDYALYPHMTVRENLSFGMKMCRRNGQIAPEEQKRRIRETANLLGLDAFLDRKPAQLSGGQRQRVSLGRAMVKEPRVFLFDEPLSNLDAQLRSGMRVEIAALHRRLGSTSIYVTHDQAEAMTLADRLVVLKEGVIQQIGAPMALYRDPVNRFVASFLGAPGMNFLEGRLDVREGERIFAYRDGEREGVVSLNFLHATPNVPGCEPGRGSLTLGIRPESLTVARSFEGKAEDEEKAPPLRVLGQVLAVEPQGYEVHIHVAIGESRWVARAKMTDLRPGEPCWIELDREAIYWFDAVGSRLRFESQATEMNLATQALNQELRMIGLHREPAPHRQSEQEMGG